MPEIQHTFTAGKMNKDLDERLLPNGQYKDALNIQVASSDGDDVGAATNILGNRLAYTSEIGISGSHCVGGIADTENEKIYWFIYGTTVDAIAEYDQITKVVTPVLVDKSSILNFSRGSKYKITAVNIIDGLLFFTDNNSEPKVVNIERCKAGSTNFDTHTVLTDQAGATYNFAEDDITVIKKGPSVPPSLVMANTKRVQSDGVTPGIITTTSIIQFATGSPLTLFEPGHTMSIAVGNFNDFEVGDILIFKAGDDANGFDDEFEVRAQINTITGLVINITILNIGDNTPTAATVWQISLKQDNPLFEKEFVRFGYRYKYKDGEYSTFSPFTEVAFLPKEFIYNPQRGYNLGMENDLRYLKITDFRPSDLPKQVEEIDIIFKKENNTNVYVVKSIKYGDEEWLNNIYELETEMIYKTIETNQLLRPFDSVPKKAQAQELVANRIVYGNYTHNFDLTNSDGVEGSKFQVSYLPRKDSSGSIIATSEGFPEKSIKSKRTYQVGVVYRDEYGRETPVQADDTGVITINKDDAVNYNALQAKVTTKPPTFANSFKFFIKETSNEYYNLAMDRWYDAEDGNVWLSFASSERNKVDEETFLILKKQHNSNDFVNEEGKYKIIAIENEAPQSLKETRTSYGTLSVEFDNSAFPIPDGTFFDFKQSVFESRFGANSEILSASGLSIRLKSPSTGTTRYYDVSTIGLELNTSGDADNQYRITIKNKFEDDVEEFFPGGVFADGVAGIELEIARTEVKNKAEFTGRFFVKVYRDALLEQKILINENAGNWSIKHQQGVFKRALGCGNHAWGDHAGDSSHPGGKNGLEERRVFVWNHNCGIEEFMGGGIYGDNPDLLKNPNGSDMGFTTIKNTYKYGVKKGRDTIMFCVLGIRKLEGAYGLDAGTHLPFIQAMTRPGGYIRFTQDATQTVYRIESTARRGLRNFNAAGNDRGWFRNQTMCMVAKLDKPIKTGTDSFSFVGPAGNPQVPDNGFATVEVLQAYSDENTFSTENPAIFETEPKEAIDLDIYYEASKSYPIDHSDLSSFNQAFTLDYFNCFSFANGVESNRIRDDFNTMTIAKGVKASAPLAEQYKEEVKKSGLIFSGIYNSTSGVNRTNQFIIAEPITKDLNPEYGSIQKLNQRDTDLTVCCEDKILKVLANKDALFEAGGNQQLTATNRVLGQTIHYVGDFGISKNPESFATYGFRSYFTDRARGVVLRLSRDGLTPISQHGMVDYFRDKLATYDTCVGSYDDSKGLYNITLDSSTARGGEDTVSFKEQVTGWPSRKSFLPEFALSLNNIYYSFKDGELYSHDSVIRNTFYSVSYRYGGGLLGTTSTSNFEGSRLTLVLNDSPATIKSFKTISYEGSQSRVVSDGKDTDGLLYNLTAKSGWYVDSIVSDKQSGLIPEFIEKEGKWFNYIKGEATTLLNLDSKEFNVQGIGTASTVVDSSTPTQVVITIEENAD